MKEQTADVPSQLLNDDSRANVVTHRELSCGQRKSCENAVNIVYAAFPQGVVESDRPFVGGSARFLISYVCCYVRQIKQ